ncbi:MAG: DUF255 domain-containing protein, partial [Proteobacteria bacterium]|nr:DUF255 domain-containing protein [Pseudomonadota bacterium]
MALRASRFSRRCLVLGSRWTQYATRISPMRNALSGETSPYLLQHKDNPVQWQPWSQEAHAA